jgi:lambda family phage portal protein
MAGPVRFRVKGTRQYIEPIHKATAFDGGTRVGRVVRWAPASAGPNAITTVGLQTIRGRSRDLVRENGYAQAGVEALVSNIVGSGIVPQFTTPDAAFNKELSAAFLEWTDEADADGRLDFYGLQALAVRSMIEGGDAFVRMRVRLPSDGLSVPLQVQVLEAEYCPDDKNGRQGGNDIRCGVEFSPIGQRVAYWLTRQHPNDWLPGGLLPRQETFRVPVTEVAHLALVSRPGMIRGEPWLARALVKLHDLDAYDDAQLIRQKIAALFTGFIRRELPATEGDEADLFGPPVAVGDGVALASLEPGTMQVLDDGESIDWSAPPSPGDNYEEFMAQQLRGVAASIGVLYEQLTGHYKDMNDRTFRAAVNEFRRRCGMWQHHVVVFQVCRPVIRRWAELAVLSGRVKLPAGISLGMVARPKWVPQGWAYINPTQDVQAKENEVRAGFKSRGQIVSEDGYDVEQVDAEMAADNARADRLGLILSSDARRTSGAGVTQARPAGSEFVETET